MRLLYVLFFLFSLSLSAQKITVLDVDTREPIVGVTLYNSDKTKSTITDFDGMASISAFAKAETIIFTGLTHQEARLTKAQIESFQNRVFLKQKENILGEIVLSASKFAQSKSKVPQKIIGLNSADIALANPQTSADLLESSGQVFVQKSQLGGGSPIIRGFSTNRLLITLDGVRFNTAIFRGGNVQNVISIDPFTIERTEVILGPGSVIYGSDAIGGVMNFYTKKPQLAGADAELLTGGGLVRYSTANNEKTVHADLSYGKEKWAYFTSVTFSDYEDLKMGKYGPDAYLRTDFVKEVNGEDVIVTNPEPRLQKGTAFSSHHLAQKIRYVPNSVWDLSLNLLYSNTSDVPRYDRLTQRDTEDTLRYAEWYYGPQQWLMTNLQANKEGNGVWYDRMQATLAYQYFEESRNDRRFQDNRIRSRTERVNAYSMAVDFSKNFTNRKNKLYYGVEYVTNYVNSNGSSVALDNDSFELVETRYPDGSHWNSLAAYVSGQFELSQKASLISGLRYNHILLDADFSDNNSFFNFPFESTALDFGNITGSLGLNYAVLKAVRLTSNFSTAFRAPNIDDVGKIFESGDGNLIVPNTDLKAEYAYNIDVGADVTIGKIARFDVNLYRTWLQDALVRRPYTLNGETSVIYQGEPALVFAIQNAATARIKGIEFGGRIFFTRHLTLQAQLNITDGTQTEDDGSEQPVRHVPPTFGNSHLTYTKGKWKFDGFVEFAGTLEADELAPSEVDKPYLYALNENGAPFSPSWYTVNLATQYQLSSKWTATLNLENITDQRYRTYSSGIAAAGRNVIMALRYAF